MKFMSYVQSSVLLKKLCDAYSLFSAFSRACSASFISEWMASMRDSETEVQPLVLLSQKLSVVNSGHRMQESRHNLFCNFRLISHGSTMYSSSLTTQVLVLAGARHCALEMCEKKNVYSAFSLGLIYILSQDLPHIPPLWHQVHVFNCHGLLFKIKHYLLHYTSIFTLKFKPNSNEKYATV